MSNLTIIAPWVLEITPCWENTFFSRALNFAQNYTDATRLLKSKNRMGLVTRPGRSWFRPWRSGRTRGVRCRKPVPVEAAAPGSDWGSLCTAGCGRRGSCQAAPLGFAGRDQQSQRQLSPWGFWPPGRTACWIFDRLFLDVFSKRSRSRWNLEFFF